MHDPVYCPWVSFVTLFGSLSSVQCDCTISEMISFCINTIGIALLTMYIDDICAYARKGHIHLRFFLVHLILSLVGYRCAEHKEGCSEVFVDCGNGMWEVAQRAVKLLGIDYNWNFAHVSLSMPLERLERLSLARKRIEDEIQTRSLSLKSLRPFIGMYRSMADCMVRQLRGLPRKLEELTDDNFEAEIRHKERRLSILLITRLMYQAAVDAQPVKIGKNQRPHRHVYTDASWEDKQGVAWIGGLVLLRDRVVAFKLMIRREELAPALRQKADIGLFELIAVFVGQRLFREFMNGCHTIHHVDNAGDVFVLVKGYGKSEWHTSASQAILKNTGDDPVYYWLFGGRSGVGITDRTSHDWLVWPRPLRSFIGFGLFQFPVELRIELTFEFFLSRLIVSSP